MKTKRVLSIILAMMFLCSNVFAAPIAAIMDMPTGWSEPAVKDAVENDVLRAENGLIRPMEELTRAEMAEGIVNAFGSTRKGNLSAYTDVPANAWYYDAMQKAVGMGIITGYGNGLIKPEKKITREEMFTVIYNALSLEKGNTYLLNKFNDGALVSDWARGIVARLVENHYVAGNAKGNIKATERITREEFAQVMKNIFAGYYNVAGTYTEVPNGNIIISKPGVVLKNVEITGDLIIADGIGAGEVTLDNVSVSGRTLVRGGGENSSVKLINNTSLNGNIIVNNNYSTVGINSINSKVTNADVRTPAILEGDFVNVTINNPIKVVIKGNVDKILVNAKADIQVVSGTVKEIDVKAQGTTISGSGKVTQVNANASDVTVTVEKTKVTAATNVTGVKAGNNEVQPGKTATIKSSSGGGGGGSSSGGSSGGGGSSSSSKVTLNYNANGGTGTPGEQSVTGSSYTFTVSSTAPTRTGYKFLGWADSATATSAVYKEGSTITVSSGTKTIYAVWECEVCTTINCTKEHVYCEEHKKYDCEDNHITYGDVNKDGTLNMLDVAVLTQYLSGIIQKIDEDIADVFKDNKIDNMDVITLRVKLTINNLEYPHTCGSYKVTYNDSDLDNHSEKYECSCGNIVDDSIKKHEFVEGTCVCGAKETVNTECIVTFSGSSVSPQTVEKGSTATKPSDPTKTGYTFDGWYTDNSYNEGYKFETLVTEDITLHAKWVANTYTVTYEVNDGTLSGSNTKEVTYDAEYGDLDTPERKYENVVNFDANEGSVNPTSATSTREDTFNGWYLAETDNNGSGTKITAESKVTTAENHTLYASWTENDYSSVTLPSATKEGHKFAGWSDGSKTYGAGESYTPLGDVTLTAQWTKVEPTQCTVTFSGSNVSPQTVEKGKTVTKPTDPTKSGYTFVGWYTDEELTAGYKFETPVIGDITLHAKFVANTYTVTFDSNYENLNIPSMPVTYDAVYGELPTIMREYVCEIRFIKNSEIINPSDSLFSTRKDTFNGWYLAETDNNGSGTKITEESKVTTAENHTLYASWTTNTYSSIKLPTPTKEGHKFDGWSDGRNTYAAGESYTPSENVTLTAQWTKVEETPTTYTVTWVDYDETELEVDENVTAGSTPTYNGTKPSRDKTEQYIYEFIGWTPEIGPVTADITYTATYTEEKRDYEVTLSDGQEEIGKIGIGYNGIIGEKYQSINKEGYTFSGWYTDAEFTNVFEILTTPITKDITIYAKFVANTYTVTFDTNIENASESSKTVTYDGTYGELSTPERKYEYVVNFNANEGSVDPTSATSTRKDTFNGWYLAETDNNGSGTKVTADSKVTTAEKHTLYASWTSNPYSSVTLPTPTREGYKFDGWSDGRNTYAAGESYTPSGDVTLIAQWTKVEETPTTYRVTWKNYDGKVLETDENVAKGSTPTYDGEDPSQDKTLEYSYIFNGWTPEIGPVTADITYTAVYTQICNQYNVVWKNDDGTTLRIDYDVEYGTIPDYGGIPTRPLTSGYKYEFVSWDPEVVPVGGSTRVIEYTATYNKISATTCTVRFNGTDLDNQIVEAGTVVAKPTTPKKNGYKFIGWYTSSSYTTPYDFETPVTENITIYAKWISEDVPTLAKQNTWYKGEQVTRSEITKITIQEDSYTPDEDVTVKESWNADKADSGKIMCYVVNDTELIIAGNGSEKICANEDSQYMFGSTDNVADVFENVTSIKGLQLLDTSTVTNMYGMFARCKSLAKLDLSTFDTSNVKQMQAMFKGCEDLAEVDISSFYMNNLEEKYYSSYMFDDCVKLSKLILGENNIFVDVGLNNENIIGANGNWYDEYGNEYTVEEITARHNGENKTECTYYAVWHGDLDLNGYIDRKDLDLLDSYIEYDVEVDTDRADTFIDGNVDYMDWLTIHGVICNENSSTTIEYPHECGTYTKLPNENGYIYSCICDKVQGTITKQGEVLVGHEYVNGQCKCGAKESTMYGDINGDGSITYQDAMMLWGYISPEIAVEIEGAERIDYIEEYGDVDNDGDLDNDDITIITAYANGKISDLPHAHSFVEGLCVCGIEGTENAIKHQYGDVNGDESVTEDDALLLFQYSMFPDLYGSEVIEEVETYGDTNDDGILDIEDSIIIWAYIKGNLTELPHTHNYVEDVCSCSVKEPVIEKLYGDVTGDGRVTEEDAIVLSQYNKNSDLYESKVIEDIETYGDVDNDSNLDADDVIIIQAYVDGKINALPHTHEYVNGACACGIKEFIEAPTLASGSNWYASTTKDKALITKITITSSSDINAEDVDEAWDASAAEDESIMCYLDGSEVTIVGNGAKTILANKNSSQMFCDFKHIETIDGLELLDTSNVENMSSMFKNCWDLKEINLSKFDTSNVTTMAYMFADCDTLTEIDASVFDTSRVEYMNHMFYMCDEVANINFSKFNTSSVTNMSYMFYSCDKLEELNLSSFNTSSVTTMAYMFYCDEGEEFSRIVLGENFRFVGENLYLPDITWYDEAGTGHTAAEVIAMHSGENRGNATYYSVNPKQ